MLDDERGAFLAADVAQQLSPASRMAKPHFLPDAPEALAFTRGTLNGTFVSVVKKKDLCHLACRMFFFLNHAKQLNH